MNEEQSTGGELEHTLDDFNREVDDFSWWDLFWFSIMEGFIEE